MGWPGPMTHRQWRCWTWWQDQQWNRPSRADWYAMQVAAMQSSKEGARVDDFKLRFDGVEDDRGRSSSSQEAEGQPFMVDGKPFGPRRLTKEDKVRLEQEHVFARVEMQRRLAAKAREEQAAREAKRKGRPGK